MTRLVTIDKRPVRYSLWNIMEEIYHLSFIILLFFYQPTRRLGANIDKDYFTIKKTIPWSVWYNKVSVWRERLIIFLMVPLAL